jgi:hypothetical protein
MVQYIYFVKCPNCEDEHFDFFDEAKEFALGCLGSRPIITQTEVCRNDFGECTDSSDLGTVWSWEDEVKVTDEEPVVNVFTKGDFADYNPDADPEFDSLDNSVDFDIDDIPDNFHMPVTEESANKFVIVGEFEDYTKQFYDADTATWVARAEDATLYDDRNDAITVLSDLDTSEFYTTKVMIKLTEGMEQLATNKKGDYLVKASSNKGYTVFNKSDVAIGGFDGDDDEVAIKRFNRGDIVEGCKGKPIPEGMTIEQLVEEMEENEDTVECTWCNELFDKSECRKEVDLGWLCSRCEAAIKSRGETLTFRENNYWDFLDEDVSLTEANATKWVCYFDDKELGVIDADSEEMALEKMQQVFPENNYGEYDGCFWVEPVEV